MNEIAVLVSTGKSIPGSNMKPGVDNQSSPVQADMISLSENDGKEETALSSLRKYARKHPTAAATINSVAGVLTGYSLEKHNTAKKLEKDIDVLQQKNQALKKDRLETEKKLEALRKKIKTKKLPSENTFINISAAGAILGAAAGCAMGASIPLFSAFLFIGSMSAISSVLLLNKISDGRAKQRVKV